MSGLCCLVLLQWTEKHRSEMGDIAKRNARSRNILLAVVIV